MNHRQTSCRETPERNFIVESKYKHLLNVTGTLLFYAHLPKIYWYYGFQNATLFLLI